MQGSPGTSLRGGIHLYPFGKTDRPTVVATHYQKLREEYDPGDILCLTRLCSDQDLTDSITNSIAGVEYPTVTSVTDFAAETLRAFIPGVTTLSDHERIELLAKFLDEYEWESKYLIDASQKESFQQDVGELLIEMESRNAVDPASYESPILQEIATAGREFQSVLEDKQYVDRPSIIPRSTAELEANAVTADMPQSISQWDVVLVADFEELAQTERRFLSAVAEAADASIVAIAERDSRLLSTWREAGDVDSLADGLEKIPHTIERETVSKPDAVGEYLVTGDQPTDPVDGGSVKVIEAPTFRDQLTAVADEIERLCRTDGYSYSDISIAFQDSSGPVEDTNRLLRRHGIPTTSVTVGQLGNDPAVKELHDLTKVCADIETEDETDQTVSRDRLLAREDATETLLAELEAAPTAAAGLWNWIETTQLKHRIGSQWSEFEARDQFQRVKTVTRLAEFLADEDRLDGSWEGFQMSLERAFRYAGSQLENIETDHDDGGVSVTTIYGMKHTTTNAVFLLNVTDSDYPFTPDLTALLPTVRLQSEPQFPLLTSQTATDVTDTFRPAGESPGDPFHDYFTQVSRRLLGIGARAASDRLYFGVPRESGESLGTYLQPSRFLTEIVETFPFIEPLNGGEETQITSHGGASEFVVEHVDDTLEAVRRASVGGEMVDLDAYEQELAAIAQLVDQPEAAAINEALTARIDFRHGRVSRD